jgi:hypothetical protein
MNPMNNRIEETNETIASPEKAPARGRLAWAVLPALGLGAIACLTGCDVTVRQPGLVVTTPGVVVTQPAVVVDTPSVAVAAPVVVDEPAVGVAIGGVPFVAVAAPEEYVLIGGRYAYWHADLGRWFYRPAGWRPPAGYRVREVHNFAELGRIHQEIRRDYRNQQQQMRKDERLQGQEQRQNERLQGKEQRQNERLQGQEQRQNERLQGQEQRKDSRVQQQEQKKQEQKKQQPKKEEKKKEEKK